MKFILTTVTQTIGRHTPVPNRHIQGRGHFRTPQRNR